VATSSSSPSTRTRRSVAIGAAVAAMAVGGVVSVPLFAGAQQAGHLSSKPKPILQERKVGKYGEVLTSSAGYSLYLLTSEASGKLHCTSSTCLKYWSPLYVAKDAMITAAPGIKGKTSHVTRGSRWQVTYNGWPVYTFAGDSGPGKTKGEGVVAGPGATWYLVNAAATKSSGTALKPAASSGTTTTTTSGATTTTTYASGY